MPEHKTEDAVVHGRVVAALLAAGRDSDWVDVDPYLTGVLPRHARLAGDPTVLVADADYPLVADPDAMLNALPPTGELPKSSRRPPAGRFGRFATLR